MFQHNYLLVNGIVSFPSFTWLYKYEVEYKQGKMWHSAQRADISEEIYMFQPGRCQAMGTWFISAETNNEELLIARQCFRNHGYINGNVACCLKGRNIWGKIYICSSIICLSVKATQTPYNFSHSVDNNVWSMNLWDGNGISTTYTRPSTDTHYYSWYDSFLV
jgi:hypothetical protein